VINDEPFTHSRRRARSWKVSIAQAAGRTRRRRSCCGAGGGEGGVGRPGELSTTDEDQLQRLHVVDEDQAGGTAALGDG
jgi:hypothetical protein